MQRVVRLSIVGLLAAAGLTACGDKVTVPPPITQAVDSSVHSVTVTPSSITLTSIGSSATLGVSVDAGAGVKDLTVKWTSSNTAIATVDQSGKVTAVSGGSTTIVAASNANPAVSGAATVTVSVPGSTVHSVSITPATMQLNQGASGAFAATVNADAGVTNLGVTWSSSDTTIATIDANGNATASATKAGTVVIRATSKADATVSGVASLTVVGSAGAVPTVTISSLTSVNAQGNEVPANLSNVNGQLNVYLNVDANGATLKSVSATLTCGADSMTQTQTISSGNKTTSATKAAAPVVFSFNTAAFDSTGKAALHNGTCSVSAQAQTAAGTQSANVSTQFTLNNADAVYGSISIAHSASDKNGLLWYGGPSTGGDVKVTVTPVFYTAGRASVSGVVSLTNNGAAFTQQTLGAGQQTVTFSANATPAKGGTLGTTTTGTGLGATVTFIDNAGNQFALAGNAFTNAANLGPTRYDTQAPDAVTAGNVTWAATQNTANGWVGTNYSFNTDVALKTVVKADSANPVLGVLSSVGVDVVTDSMQYAVHNGKTFTTFTSVGQVPETSTGNAYDLQVKVCDALGNCSISPVLGQFGVDVTAPVINKTTGVANNSVFGIGAAVATAVGVQASDSASTAGAVGSGFGATPVLVSETRLSPSGASGSQTSCSIGTATGTAPSITCKAPAAQPLNFNGDATVPGQYSMTFYVVDQAGNQSAPMTLQYYIDQAAPVVAGGMTIPGTIANNSSFSANATDDMDLASGNGVITYPTATTATGASVKIATCANNSALPCASMGGVAFDNVLTRTGTATANFSNSTFYNDLASSVALATNPKPTTVGVRAVDAAGNLSTEDQAGLPAANITTGTAYDNTKIGAGNAACAGNASFCVASSAATVSVAGKNSNPTTTTLTATLYAATSTSTTPFSQVCFYTVTPSGAEGAAANTVTGTATGDLVLIGCSTTPVTTTDNTAGQNRIFQYSVQFTPNKGYAGVNPLNVVAIGSNASGDAVITDAAAGINVTP